MHIFKCAEVDFYETEASLTIPMLETVRLKIMKITKNLFTVLPRTSTEVELQQIHNLGLYMEWRALKENFLLPRPFNSLENVAFRKNAPLIIPKKIHQIWLSDTEPSPIRMKLHQPMKDSNPNFDVYLWKNEDLTPKLLPLSFAFMQRTLTY